MAELPRQAVVVVHGIGEQRPLDTLRGFVRRPRRRGVDGVVGPEHAVFVAPDIMRGRFDQRRLKITWRHDGAALERTFPGRIQRAAATTDVYELYWAYRFRDTAMSQVRSWLLPLLVRRRSGLTSRRLLGSVASRRLLPLLAMLLVLGTASGVVALTTGEVASWILAVSTAVAAIWTALGMGLVTTIRTAVAVIAGAAAAGGLAVSGADGAADLLGSAAGGAAAGLLAGAFVGCVTRGVGDAARYLHVTPDNVEGAEDLRQDSVELLERLHDAVDEVTGRPMYDRVVLIGHSLGSAVAYDAVRFAWSRRNRSLALPDDGADSPEHEAVCAVEIAGRRLAASDAGTGAGAAADRVWEYRIAQDRLARLLRDGVALGGAPTARWIVSDLITVGSPLAHADLLLADAGEGLDSKFDGRLLSACPPVPQRTTDADRPYRFRTPSVNDRPAATFLHQAAVFAPVRWTNLWHAHDAVGGPVAPLFGPGVEDVRGGTSEWLGWFLLRYPHSSYWQFAQRRNRAAGDMFKQCLLDAIARPPTLLIRVPAPDARLRHRLTEIFEPGGTGPAYDLRLAVGGAGKSRRYVWEPLGRISPPPPSTLDAISAEFPHATVAVCASVPQGD